MARIAALWVRFGPQQSGMHAASIPEPHTRLASSVSHSSPTTGKALAKGAVISDGWRLLFRFVYFPLAFRETAFFRPGLAGAIGAVLRPSPMVLASAERWAA
jgi:hypothetical protein